MFLLKQFIVFIFFLSCSFSAFSNEECANVFRSKDVLDLSFYVKEKSPNDLRSRDVLSLSSYIKNSTPLMKAITKGDREELKKLIQQGADVNFQRKSLNDTALMLATLIGDLASVKILIQAGADPNLRGINNVNALYLAVEGRYFDIATYLIQNKTDFKMRGLLGQSILSSMFELWDVKNIKKIMLVGGIDINSKDERGETALIISTKKGNLEAIEKIISLGGGVNIKNDSKETALGIQAEAIFVNTVDPRDELDIFDSVENRKQAIRKEEFSGGIDIFETLVKNGGDLNIKLPNGRTPFLNLISGDYTSPELNLVKKFTSSGADIHIKDDEGNTALMYAAHKMNLEVIDFLIKKGLNVNSKNKLGETPLIFAFKRAAHELKRAKLVKPQVVQLLIDSGADVNAKDFNGNSALSIAIQESNLYLFKKLIQAGADVNIKNPEGDTLLDYVRKLNDPEMEKIIREQQK